MTINGGQPHRVGYAGQDWRIVVDEDAGGESARVRRVGWASRQDPETLSSLNTRPGWSGARYERVTDKQREYEV